jgi:ketosteroid isomerase-like protein
MSDLETLLAKDEIRELVMLYSRAVDRQDVSLLRELYTADATDSHGDTFDGPASEYCDFLEQSLPHIAYSGHHVCNHLIAVDGDAACGEVYALAWHVFPTREGGMAEDLIAVRYLDNYCRESDGKWRFAKRVVTYDMRKQGVFDGEVKKPDTPEGDPAFAELQMRLFQRGARH